MTAFRGDLLPHQEEGLAFLQAQPRAVLADEVGLGKTVQAASLIGWLAEQRFGADRGSATRAATESLLEEGSHRLPVLWVTAASLLRQTADELERFLPSLTVVTTTCRRKGQPAPDILLTTHSLAQTRHLDLEALRPSLVVVDEASALKGAGARFEAVQALCASAERSVAMTATPYENDPMELWAVLAIACIPYLHDADTFGDRYVRWQTFSSGQQKPTGWKSPGHAGAVRRWMGERYLRRVPGDLGLSMPQKVDSGHVLVPLSPTQQDAYNRASRIGHPLTRHQRQSQASRRGKDGSSSLLDAVTRETLNQARSGAKTVVYTEYLDDLDELSSRLTRTGIGHVTLRGDDSKASRAGGVGSFRDDPSVAVLLGTKVLEYGLNLQFANVLISCGQTYNPARERQREGRLCRIGSPNRTFRHLVYLPDTPTTRRQVATLGHKSQQAAYITGHVSTSRVIPGLS